MSETTQFTIGAQAICSDGNCGNVIRVVVDPVAKTVTHLVVEPKHRQGFGRLVPLDLVESTSTDEIRLRCTVSEFEKLQPAEETHFLPGTDPFGGYGPGLVLLHPYYGLGAGMVSGPLGIASPMDLGAGNLTPPIIHDLVPEGEVEVRRGEQVHATDGDIGRVQGLVIDPRTHQVTHVLLQEGHLWGRKQVAIPIDRGDRRGPRHPAEYLEARGAGSARARCRAPERVTGRRHVALGRRHV